MRQLRGRHRKICTFGYVVTDAHFRPLEQKDILICPHSHYEWYVRKKILAYPVSEINAQPDFPAKYDELRALLEKPGRKVFGYNVGADMSYIMSECFRYDLPFPDFESTDIQKMFQTLEDLDNPVSLEKALAAAGEDPGQFTEHRSDSDALMSAYVLKHLFERYPGQAEELAASGGEGLLWRSGLSSTPRQLLQKITAFFASGEPGAGPLSGRTFCIDEAFAATRAEAALRLVSGIVAKGGTMSGNGVRCGEYLSYGEYRARRPKAREVRWEAVKKTKGIVRRDITDFAESEGISLSAYGRGESEEIRRRFVAAEAAEKAKK